MICILLSLCMHVHVLAVERLTLQVDSRGTTTTIDCVNVDSGPARYGLELYTPAILQIARAERLATGPSLWTCARSGHMPLKVRIDPDLEDRISCVIREQIRKNPSSLEKCVPRTDSMVRDGSVTIVWSQQGERCLAVVVHPVPLAESDCDLVRLIRKATR